MFFTGFLTILHISLSSNYENRAQYVRFGSELQGGRLTIAPTFEPPYATSAQILHDKYMIVAPWCGAPRVSHPTLAFYKFLPGQEIILLHKTIQILQEKAKLFARGINFYSSGKSEAFCRKNISIL
ncbi:MAG: hypothetical protein FWH01_02165 [Oscillospiraceae bacterium]|nr:hypothetical protein [Oscillospiraceae bacterium]